MDKNLVGLLGAMGALVAIAPAQAALAPALRADSYRELLQPIPNASETLQALGDAGARVQLAEIQIYAGSRHDHHHRYVRRPPPRRQTRHHHHHHRSF